jgi:hypothetical protein
MSAHLIGAFRNIGRPVSRYRPGDRLLPAVMFRLRLPGDTNAEQPADWTFRVLNTDPESMTADASLPAADTAFWLVSFYRLLRLPSLSIGEVVQAVTDGDSRWLTCEPSGWTYHRAAGRIARLVNGSGAEPPMSPCP